MAAGRTAVLVVDLQVGVLAGCFDVAGVVSRSIALVERARSAGAPVVWIQHEEADMPRGSPAWQLVPGLVPAADEARVFKTCCDAFVGTSLRRVLDDLGATRLVIAGAQSDYCIRATAQRAVTEGYSIVLVRDAHTTADTAFDGVTISGEQIVAHTNRSLIGIGVPGASVDLAMHDALTF